MKVVSLNAYDFLYGMLKTLGTLDAMDDEFDGSELAVELENRLAEEIENHIGQSDYFQDLFEGLKCTLPERLVMYCNVIKNHMWELESIKLDGGQDD